MKSLLKAFSRVTEESSQDTLVGMEWYLLSLPKKLSEKLGGKAEEIVTLLKELGINLVLKG